mmetsp:Transcript_5015/g.15811  ORF Transcript_5015/g.15811 Transcript_5015/m.15811 type:complete len:177 (-) Transcript_5015:230-760(-)
MLYADKAALETRTKVRLLSIRERELELYVRNCRAVGNVSSIMAGAAFMGLLYTGKKAYFENANVLAQGLYVFGLTSTLCLGLELVMATTAITMLGPGLALRGPDGSMNSAVDGILVEFELISRILNVNIQVFLATGAAFAFLDASPNLFCSILVSFLMYACYRRANRCQAAPSLPP